MSDPIRSMAILKAHPGMEMDLLALLCEFYNMMLAKQYSRDVLYRDMKQTGEFLHIRLWLSSEARETAIHDPDVHRYWMKLPELGNVTNIYEELESVFSSMDAASPAGGANAGGAAPRKDREEAEDGS